ncbi:MAG: hypothetical protein K2Y01_02620 [Rhabdochlamydiaceae bacterium]|nr:hypothetical protein [Rhabdochlamydiaceae bacterium]
MNDNFDTDKAKKFLETREGEEKERKEIERKAALSATVDLLKVLFSHTGVEVYLVGSIIQPYKFHSRSDVDVVLRNFHGDRFEVWTQLEALIKKNVEVIIFENCHFQEHVIKNGYRVL